MAIKLNLYAKGGTTPIATGDDTTGVAVTGLAAGTVVNDGDYQVSHTDDSDTLLESDRASVPGFTVNTAAEG